MNAAYPPGSVNGRPKLPAPRVAERIIVADPAVRRYETCFVKREVKFARFVRLGRGQD